MISAPLLETARVPTCGGNSGPLMFELLADTSDDGSKSPCRALGGLGGTGARLIILGLSLPNPDGGRLGSQCVWSRAASVVRVSL